MHYVVDRFYISEIPAHLFHTEQRNTLIVICFIGFFCCCRLCLFLTYCSGQDLECADTLSKKDEL